MIAAVAAALVLFAAALAMPRADAMLVLLLPAFIALTCALSTGPAILQDITPPGLRRTQHAIAGLGATLIGLGLGPTIVALLTDRVFADERMLSLSLLLACPIMFAAALMSFLATLTPYRISLAEASLPARVPDLSPMP